MADKLDAPTLVAYRKRQRASFLSIDQTLVQLSVGENRKQFNVHKALLCTHSEYFRALFKGPWQESEDRTVHLPDVDEDIMRLFLWWLYAQPCRSSIVDPPLEDPISLLSAMESRNPWLAVRTLASHPEHTVQATASGASNLEVRAQLRRNVPAAWTQVAIVPSDSVPPTLFLRLFVFADKYTTKQLRDDIMTILVEWNSYRKGEILVEWDSYRVGEKHKKLVNNRPTLLPIAWWGYMHDNLPTNSAMYRYTVGNIASSGAFTQKLPMTETQLVPNQLLCEIIAKMSSAIEDYDGLLEYQDDCCNFHEHDDGDDILECPAYFHYDGAFFSNFLEVCYEAAEEFEKRQAQEELSMEVAAEEQNEQEPPNTKEKELEENSVRSKKRKIR